MFDFNTVITLLIITPNTNQHYIVVHLLSPIFTNVI